MTAQVLDGRFLSDSILEDVKARVQKLEKRGLKPKLAIILVGNNEASLSYIYQKKKAAEKTGIAYEEFLYDELIETETLLQKIEEINNDNSFHGILVQLPLPPHIKTPLVIRAINPKKDVDGLHAYNLGKLFLSAEFEDLVPCTPKGVIRLLQHYKIDVKGKDVTVVGHSNIVGKPLSMMFLNRDATVTTCHIHTKNLAAHTSRADILATAVGKPKLITADMVKKGAVVLDIGFSRVNNTIMGDVDFDAVVGKASAITPVPGGLGPMTVACLMENVVSACTRLAAGAP